MLLRRDADILSAMNDCFEDSSKNNLWERLTDRSISRLVVHYRRYSLNDGSGFRRWQATSLA